MKYLIVGLGNIGPEYQDTRHNIGFNVLDAFAKASNAVFEDMRYGAVCEMKLKGRTLVLLKPTQNSMRPHNRFISILPKRNVYDRLCGLIDNDS